MEDETMRAIMGRSEAKYQKGKGSTPQIACTQPFWPQPCASQSAKPSRMCCVLCVAHKNYTYQSKITGLLICPPCAGTRQMGPGVVWDTRVSHITPFKVWF
mmetsp:Transcript_35496/g.63444  ORF Transcript_35496/g.63444 Transcript_35496/m.63444 type:complete len:101 (-) Transcript_35496:62-364(-)